MYRNYIFDFYGTLADIRTDEENPLLWEKMSEIYSALGACYSAAQLRERFRFLEREESRRIGGEEAEPDLTKVFALLYQEKKVPCDVQQAKMTAITFRALSREYIRAYDGVKELLGELRRREKKVYLLSNAQTDFTRPEIEMLGLTPYFDGIFISSEQGCKKPSCVFFESLLRHFELNPRECIMIGNDESADIAGARRAGMDSLYIHTEISPREYGRVQATYRVMDGDFRKIRNLVLGE
ncbi:HAD family hydrolase [Acetatifactor muris]|uniref:HAD family hydrolase n=1 Tax=Acetatifactor muris TaxID=879566 RepID=UPI0023F15410|nr:HAD family hydrolase [Acetatifactor muris]